MEARKLLPSIVERNPYLKEQVGDLIYEHVEQLSSQEKAPKITGMLIELPVDHIKEYLSSYEALGARVAEATKLLEGRQ